MLWEADQIHDSKGFAAAQKPNNTVCELLSPENEQMLNAPHARPAARVSARNIILNPKAAVVPDTSQHLELLMPKLPLNVFAALSFLEIEARFPIRFVAAFEVSGIKGRGSRIHRSWFLKSVEVFMFHLAIQHIRLKFKLDDVVPFW